ncbi:MAG: ABC transporter permease [Bdellovibrionales bacterium]|nr:ABC transporter permease [Bdellovibrionales bacterium]
MMQFLRELGAFALLCRAVLVDVLTHGINVRDLNRQIVRIGLLSLPIVMLTAVFTGMVMAIQTAYGLERFGVKNYVGNIVGLALSRELGPVLSALMVCGRVGAGIAAEIGSMAVTEQIDAMRCLGADPITKLVTPRILAAILVLPGLVIFADLIGVYGGLLMSVWELDISAHLFYRSLLSTVGIRDIVEGLLKSAAFGGLVVALACYRGMGTTGGTEGVGRNTTATVVVGSIVIFVADFLLTKLLLVL